jgi:hypothetical protein
MALRAKIRPDETESEGCGGSTVEDDNEVRTVFRRNPRAGANSLHFVALCRSKILHNRRSSFLELRRIGTQRHSWES